MRWVFFWQPPCLLQRVLVNVKYRPDEAFQGLLWSVRGGWVTLRDVTAITGNGGGATKVDGDVILHQRDIAYFQVPMP